MYVDVCTGEVDVDGVLTPWHVQRDMSLDTRRYEFFAPGVKRFVLDNLFEVIFDGLLAMGAIRPSSKG